MIDSHFGFNSAAGISNLFCLMFADSTITQQFKMADDKSRYIAVYGLALHSMKQLADSVRVSCYSMKH